MTAPDVMIAADRLHVADLPTAARRVRLGDLRPATSQHRHMPALPYAPRTEQVIGPLAAGHYRDVRPGHRNPKPFIRKFTAEEIITKVRRGRTTLHQINTQTDH